MSKENTLIKIDLLKVIEWNWGYEKGCLKTIWLYTFTHSYTMSAGMRWLLFAFFLTLYFSESSNIVTKIGLGNNLDRQQLDKG